MKGRKALGVGGGVSSSVTVLLLSTGVSSFEILLWSVLSIFSLSFLTLLYSKLFGWPLTRFEQYDLYDLHRTVIGGALAAGIVATFSAASSKLAFVLSIHIVSAAVLTAVLFVTYLLLASAFFYLVRGPEIAERFLEDKVAWL